MKSSAGSLFWGGLPVTVSDAVPPGIVFIIAASDHKAANGTAPTSFSSAVPELQDATDGLNTTPTVQSLKAFTFDPGNNPLTCPSAFDPPGTTYYPMGD